MKYVSPIYEVEATSTEDIMLYSTNGFAEAINIKLSGDPEKMTQYVDIKLTDDAGNSNGVDQSPENTTASGISISMDFGGLFNN